MRAHMGEPRSESRASSPTRTGGARTTTSTATTGTRTCRAASIAWHARPPCMALPWATRARQATTVRRFALSHARTADAADPEAGQAQHAHKAGPRRGRVQRAARSHGGSPLHPTRQRCPVHVVCCSNLVLPTVANVAAARTAFAFARVVQLRVELCCVARRALSFRPLRADCITDAALDAGCERSCKPYGGRAHRSPSSGRGRAPCRGRGER